ncbi:MAG: MotA/TolQ/ExbB proton channel family protein [Pseudomonadales bacterium]|nr:MotA/TolQ/ExbB proton channel family protein [Pseudomonadales bacterium]
MWDNLIYALLQTFDPIIKFVEQGGPILGVIACVGTVMWWYIIERVWYFRRDYPGESTQAIQQWRKRQETNSWNAQQIRQAMISRNDEKLNHSTIVIRAIILLCPLLGLLGTVTGMIDVFDVMAASSGIDTKSMSSSVSRAIIPTMAGMIAAIFGIFGNMYIQRQIDHLSAVFEGSLATIDRPKKRINLPSP